MYHTLCIANWMKKKKKCPLCRQKINIDINENDKAKMVWNVQNEINDNRFQHISFSDLFVLSFSEPRRNYYYSYYSYNSYNSYNNHSYSYAFVSGLGRSSYSSRSGGFSSGGGATGGW